jgi:hypothetical protein
MNNTPKRALPARAANHRRERWGLGIPPWVYETGRVGTIF